ncbi:MAG: terminase, partial [Acidobacteria bacterium]|nr:terminase [Acidobacteriota bacterium]
DANKVTRARPFAAQAEAGNVFLLQGAWNEAYLDEVANFPTGKFKDQADGSSGAFNEIEFGEWGEMGGIF